ncbi:MAG: hypothetical protein ACJ796_10645 [Gemmatimonadaceae bacterium]
MWSARHHARALIATLCGTIVVSSLAWIAGCSSDRVLQPSDGDVSLSSGGLTDDKLGVPVPIDFDTYESSHQVVHASAVAFPSAWHGQRFWLALTPYPNSDSYVENPSLFSGTTGDAFAVPAGLTNPVARTTRGYLSDPDLTYDPAADELRLYYREVVEVRRGREKPLHKADVVYLSRSGDGHAWSSPTIVTTDMNRFVVSPSVARRADGDWKMWSVNAGRAGCTAKQTRLILRRSVDGVSWSTPTEVAFSQPGYLPWHLDVQYVPQLDAYWALVAAYPRGTACTATSLFLATSTDGVNWTTYPSPVLARGRIPQFSANVYRSTFAFEPGADRLTIWLTGAAVVKRAEHRKPSVLRWSAAVWHTHTQALLEHVRTARSAAAMLPDSEPTFMRHLAITNALP